MALVQHVQTVPGFHLRATTSADYKITRYLLDNNLALAGKTVFVPMNFIQGDLARVNQLMGQTTFSLTQNCLEARDVQEHQLKIFDSSGDERAKSWLLENCVQVDFEVTEFISPRYRNGLLEWALQAPNGYTAGVYFVDRAFSVPINEFSQQLVKPAIGERYQVFITDWIRWGFSDIREIDQQ